MFFVYDNTNARSKEAFLAYFIFLLPKSKNVIQEKSYVYGEDVLIVCQNWFSKFRFDNFYIKDVPRFGKRVERPNKDID